MRLLKSLKGLDKDQIDDFIDVDIKRIIEYMHVMRIKQKLVFNSYFMIFNFLFIYSHFIHFHQFINRKIFMYVALIKKIIFLSFIHITILQI